MKLRNKKTGEIRNCQLMADGFIVINSLKDLEEWEDYKEPNTIFFINEGGSIYTIKNIEDEELAELSVIGNCFKTYQEAEKAVEKLKALKRLKDKGFRFDGFDVANNGAGEICGQTYFKGGIYSRDFVQEDLYLLFGGEE